MITYGIAAQAIGLLAAVIDIYATFQKSDKKLVRIYSFGSFVFCLHYIMLGAIPGALSEGLNGTRTLLSSFTKSRILAYIFLSIYIVLLFVMAENVLETLPFISSICITIGLYFFESIKMRLWYVVGFSCWLIYAFFVQSLGGVIVFLTLLVTTTITIYRIHKDVDQS